MEKITRCYAELRRFSQQRLLGERGKHFEKLQYLDPEEKDEEAEGQGGARFQKAT